MEKKEVKNIHEGHRKRVREKVCKHGTEHLEDHELLELLLFYSIPRGDTNALSHRLIERFGSLRGVVRADADDLLGVEGVGKCTATMLKGLYEFSCRVHKPISANQKYYTTSDDYEKLAASYVYGELKETAVVFYFDKKGRKIGETVFPRGQEDCVEIDQTKILKQAVVYDAKRIVLTHNHPEGKAEPSSADWEVTRTLAVLVRKAGIALADHIIVGSDGTTLSMYRDETYKNFFY